MDEVIKKLVNRSLARFFEGAKTRSLGQLEPIRQETLEVLGRVASRQWRTYVVGGAIRDLLLAPPGSLPLPRDVDVIVDGCSSNDLESVFKDIKDIVVRRNSFGGLHLRRTVNVESFPTEQYDLLFDVWRLEDTWTIKAQELAPTIATFLSTSFLNIDSVAVALPADKRPARVFERGFFHAITNRTLEINSEHNPFPFVCVIRALILAAKLDFWIGPRLAYFIQDVASSASISELLQAQRSHYGQIRCRKRYISEWLETIRGQLKSGNRRVRLLNDQQRRLRLWQDWPPHSQLLEERANNNSTLGSLERS